MKSLWLNLAGAIVVLCLGRSAQAQSSSPNDQARHEQLTEADKNFLKYAAEDNQAEISLCLMAVKRAEAPSLKAFARLMVNDHIEVETRLAALANAEGFRLPDGQGEDGNKAEAELKPLYMAQFDGHFLKQQIEDHSNDLKKFADEAASTQNQGIKRFAAETLPILKQHLELAKAVETSVRGADLSRSDPGNGKR